MELNDTKQSPNKIQVTYNGYFMWTRARMGNIIFARQMARPELLEKEINIDTPILVGYEGAIGEDLTKILDERSELQERVKELNSQVENYEDKYYKSIDIVREMQQRLEHLEFLADRQPRFGWKPSKPESITE